MVLITILSNTTKILLDSFFKKNILQPASAQIGQDFFSKFLTHSEKEVKQFR
jgi:hypothetical protein